MKILQVDTVGMEKGARASMGALCSLKGGGGVNRGEGVWKAEGCTPTGDAGEGAVQK